MFKQSLKCVPLSAALLISSMAMPVVAQTVFSSKEVLGSALYFDQNFSKNRNQSCASCHAPEQGFIDNRVNALTAAASIGSDNVSVGDRNAPTASYAAFIPKFSRKKTGEYVGGQFHDGRANTLQDQAAGPPLNPGEMAIPDKQVVLERILENDSYQVSFKALYGDDVLNNADTAYDALTHSIASFEKTEFFAPFDSKYDRYLRGEYTMTEQESLGETLFFSQQFSNCNVCHQLKRLGGQAKETFTNYEYRNIGVPINKALRSINGKSDDFIDHGLLENPLVTEIEQDGKFKTPTLRNVAVSGPYMHNGVFKDLKTVVLFYDKYNSRKKSRQINPETNKPWGEPEVAATLALKELKIGKAFSNKRVDALVAFMKTLTDKRYEHLVYKK